MVTCLANTLETLYNQYNRQEYIDPDPLAFLYKYPHSEDQEAVGFISASFAYGRVEMIMKTVCHILDALGPEPVRSLKGWSEEKLMQTFKGFRYRFAKDQDLVDLLSGIGSVLTRFGSLENCFMEGQIPNDRTVLSGLQFLSKQIRGHKRLDHLLADPNKTSACKRSHLFLRWMVRKDEVDPGCWSQVEPSKLIVPLDRHMHHSGALLGFTRRKSADLKTALEITQGFRAVNQGDPVKYDFCLTRFGIRRDLAMETLEKMVGFRKEH